MSEDLFDSPPVHEPEHEEHAEQEPHPDESDLTHLELGEAVAATRRPAVPRKISRPKPRAPRAPFLAFLHLEHVPSDNGSGNAWLAVWIAVQLAAIALSAARWKFWARAGDAGSAPSIELLALHTLLIAQLAVSTLIYPMLLDSWAKLVLTASTMIAFDALAWIMTGVAPMAAFWACAVGVMWVVGLAAWRAAAPGAFATMVVRLALLLLVLGWPIMVYLHGEFAVDSNGTFAGAGSGGPLFAAVDQLQSPRLATETWVTVVTVTGGGGVVWMGTWLTRWRRSRAREST